METVREPALEDALSAEFHSLRGPYMRNLPETTTCC